ncbi:MAG: DNA recombination protein RmuC [Parvularcula sp.]|nr:DNA recombination protein RmuC [Parvularcula sp.]
MSGSDLTIWVIIGVVFLLVIAALAIIYGRLSREKGDYDDDHDVADPFRDGDERNDGYYHDDFSAIRITRDERNDEPVFDDEPEDEPTPMIRDRFAVGGGDPFRNRSDVNENVVPLRANEPPAEPPFMADMPRREVASAAETKGTEYRYGGSSGSERGFVSEREDDRTPVRTYEDDDSQPFSVPYIRESIEEAERRQNQRLDDFRSDMRRELSGIREEQSNRLDHFLSSIDRKIGQAVSPRSELEDSAARRRIDNLSTAVDRVSEALDRHDDRLGELSRSVEKRMADMAPLRADLRTVHEDVLSFKRDLEANTTTIRQLKDDFDILRENFGRMERTFLDKARNDGSVTMRLADVVRETLRADEFEMNARLSNGANVDCLIYLNNGRSKVAVDGRFPVESFEQLPSRDAVRRNMPQAKAAEDNFRRTVLRSIFSCADRCIVSGETVDSAIMFLPSEAAYTVLHDRFPDLVRDSHRARVWLTSPSTLMGTLNLLHNIIPEKEAPATEDYARLSVDDPIDRRFDDEGPFYAGPAEQNDRSGSRKRDDEDTRAEAIERKLLALREEEEALAEELMRRRRRREPAQDERRRDDFAQPSFRSEDDEGTPRRRRYLADDERENDGKPQADDDDFESRFERFTFDLDESRSDFESTRPRRSFHDDRDDDLR